MTGSLTFTGEEDKVDRTQRTAVLEVTSPLATPWVKAIGGAAYTLLTIFVPVRRYIVLIKNTIRIGFLLNIRRQAKFL